MIVRNVIDQALREELNKDVQGKKVCILLDQSTNISTVMLLCFLMHHFSQRDSSTKTTLISLFELIHTNEEGIFQEMKKALN